MLKKLWDLLQDNNAWEIDKKSKGSLNLYMVNSRTGDRKIIMNSSSYQPVDVSWMAQTANTTTVIGRCGQVTVYDRAALDEMLRTQERCTTPPLPLPKR